MSRAYIKAGSYYCIDTDSTKTVKARWSDTWNVWMVRGAEIIRVYNGQQDDNFTPSHEYSFFTHELTFK